MKRSLILVALVLAAVSSSAQQQGGAVTLFQGYTGTSQSYGWYARNQAAGTGTNLWSGYGNYGSVGVSAPTGGSTGVGSGLLGVGAFNDRNFGVIGRATAFKAGATNIGGAFWAYNEDAGGTPSGKIVGIYSALSDLPASKAELDAELEPAAVLVDSKDSAAPAIVARIAGVTSFSVPAAGQLRLHDTGMVKPACGAGHAGEHWYEAGAPGVADTYEVCTKDAADVYAWRTAI